MLIACTVVRTVEQDIVSYGSVLDPGLLRHISHRTLKNYKKTENFSASKLVLTYAEVRCASLHSRFSNSPCHAFYAPATPPPLPTFSNAPEMTVDSQEHFNTITQTKFEGEGQQSVL